MDKEESLSTCTVCLDVLRLETGSAVFCMNKGSDVLCCAVAGNGALCWNNRDVKHGAAMS